MNRKHNLSDRQAALGVYAEVTTLEEQAGQQ